MKGPQHLLTIALALSPLTAAWSGLLPDLDALVVRQDQSSNNDQPTQTASPQSSATSDAPKETGDSSATQTDKGGSSTGSSSPSGSGSSGSSGSGTASKTKSSPPKHTTFNALDPAGGVSMIDPPATAALQLYRIDNIDPITWKWNYTSLQGTPTGIDVLISYSSQTETWTLTQNMSFVPTATFTWDSRDFQQKQIGDQLPVAKYTLLIHDSAGSITDTPQPGFLAPFAGFQFGLYTAKPYVNLSEWVCATCSAAPGSLLDRQALGFAFSMTLLTVLSFTWYVTGIAALI
ncbi:hypothetical protein GGR50DRAFT_665300 [Xylaria sp. CBS 124048]|nr:hypothetical protein GGR50DRAFT_665300 [Xylaria sp. CBS 124048]